MRKTSKSCRPRNKRKVIEDDVPYLQSDASAVLMMTDPQHCHAVAALPISAVEEVRGRPSPCLEADRQASRVAAFPRQEDGGVRDLNLEEFDQEHIMDVKDGNQWRKGVMQYRHKRCRGSVVLHFGDDEYEGLNGDYSFQNGVLFDGDRDPIQIRNIIKVVLSQAEISVLKKKSKRKEQVLKKRSRMKPRKKKPSMKK